MSPDNPQPGNGLLLFFCVDDFDIALKRARALVSRLDEGPHVNPSTETQEFSLRDSDGYYMIVREQLTPVAVACVLAYVGAWFRSRVNKRRERNLDTTPR